MDISKTVKRLAKRKGLKLKELAAMTSRNSSNPSQPYKLGFKIEKALIALEETPDRFFLEALRDSDQLSSKSKEKIVSIINELNRVRRIPDTF